MLFDLNMITITDDNDNDDDKDVETGGTELSSTSSTSSIVNAADDSPISDVITHQLFPATACAAIHGGGVADVDVTLPGVANNSHSQWLNLSVSGSGSSSGSGLGTEKQQVRKSRRGPRSRSSQYRGVTFYRRTGRWESHIWDCGKQVYLGGFDTAHAAARAYDRAAIKFRGVDADINFNITDYDEDMKQVKNLTKEEFVQVLRRQTTGQSRGNSRFRGAMLPKCGPWEAPMAQFLGNKVYDQTAIQAVTNFEPRSYDRQIPILANNEGHGHNLDLNLGISLTIDGPKARNSMGAGDSQTPGYPNLLANENEPMNKALLPYQSPGAVPLYGQPMVSRQSTMMWSELPQGRPGTHEERVSEQKNWAWYMESQGQGGGTVNQVQFSSSAASSGFPFSAATTSATLFRHPSLSNNNSTNPYSLHQHGQGRQ
ncbi:hypothetical protein vseg_002733 [Gypsophila vaccaria]